MRPTRQRGSVLLFALIALLLLFIGALFTFRGVLTDTGLTDRFSQRQKNFNASDLALQWIATQIGSAGNTQPLEVSASSQSWFLNVSPGANVQPNAAYWATCIAGSTAQDKCASVPMPTGVGQSAWVFVQPTGRVDPYACNTQGLTAVYYDLWIHTVDARQQSPADVESLYKLCVLGGASS